MFTRMSEFTLSNCIARNRKEWKNLGEQLKNKKELTINCSVNPHNKNSRSHGLAHHVKSWLSISLLGGGPCPAWDIRALFIYLSSIYRIYLKTLYASLPKVIKYAMPSVTILYDNFLIFTLKSTSIYSLVELRPLYRKTVSQIVGPMTTQGIQCKGERGKTVALLRL